IRAYDLPVPGIPHLYTHLPKTPRTEPGKNELHYCQRGLPFTSSGSQTEFIWKRDIRLGWKALRLKAKHANLIRYCKLGKLGVLKASNQNKALADFQGEPRRASADSSISTATWSEFVIEREGFGRAVHCSRFRRTLDAWDEQEL